MAGEYIAGKAHQLTLQVSGCEFVGCLWPRRAGGFDLMLDRENSEFEGLEVDQITKLRHQARDHGGVFVAQLLETQVTRELKERAVRSFAAWLEQNFALSVGRGPRVSWDEVEIDA